MEQSVSLAPELTEDGSKIGAQTIQKNLIEIIKNARNKIAELLKTINNSYKKIANESSSIEDIKRRQDQIRQFIKEIKQNIEEEKELVQPSSKGDKADIAPENFAEKVNKEQEKVDKLYEALSLIRNNTYGTTKNIKDKDVYKQTALKAMEIVYSLRQAITGKTEKIIFAYEGDSKSGQIYTTEIPIIDFLKNKGIAEHLSISMQATSSFTGSDPFQLSFKSSIISQLKNIQTDENTKKDFKYQIAQDQIIKTKEEFLTYLSKLDDPVIRYREDYKKGYKVLKRGVAGYILENMLASIMDQANKDITLAQRGNDVWYTGGDFSANGIEYSAKSMLMGNPTLVKMSSIQMILQELYKILDVPSIDEIRNKITSLFKAGAEREEYLVNQDISKVLEELTKE